MCMWGAKAALRLPALVQVVLMEEGHLYIIQHIMKVAVGVQVISVLQLGISTASLWWEAAGEELWGIATQEGVTAALQMVLLVVIVVPVHLPFRWGRWYPVISRSRGNIQY